MGKAVHCVGLLLLLLLHVGVSGDDRLALLPLGDSYTACNGMKKDFSFAYLSYREPLYHMFLRSPEIPSFASRVAFVGTRSGCNKKLEAKYPAALEIPQPHDAFFGRTAKSIANQAKEIGKTTYPDIMFLLIGLNDFLIEQAVAEDVMGYIKRIALDIYEAGPSPKLYIATLPPILPSHRKAKKMYVQCMHGLKEGRRLNEMLRAANITTRLTIEGKSVPFHLVDMDAGFDPNTMTYDGIHPNRDGEKFLARRWYDAVAPLLRKYPYGIRVAQQQLHSTMEPSPLSTTVEQPAATVHGVTLARSLPSVPVAVPVVGDHRVAPEDVSDFASAPGYVIGLIVVVAVFVLVCRRRGR